MRRSGPHGEVRGILISVLGHLGPSLYGSGAGRVSIARLAEAPFTRAPRRSAATERGVLRPDQGHGGHARSSPTQSACDEEPGSRRPPGGRVAAAPIDHSYAFTWWEKRDVWYDLIDSPRRIRYNGWVDKHGGFMIHGHPNNGTKAWMWGTAPDEVGPSSWLTSVPPRARCLSLC